MKQSSKKTTTAKPLSEQHARVFALINDPQQGEGAIELSEWLDQMVSCAGISYDRDASIFALTYGQAAHTIEQMPRPRRMTRRNLKAWSAWQAYDCVQEMLARVEAGESLESIRAERYAQMRANDERRRQEQLNAPEPKDKLSDEWRHWKIGQITHGFRGGDTAAYQKAWDEFEQLLEGLSNDPNFWHIDHARSILPQLIIARQSIDREALTQRRSDSAARGARARKAKK